MGQFDEEGRNHPGATGAGRRIYDLLRSQIADGTLLPGARVMSTRAQAAELGVSRTTVTAVYEQLTAEGFLVTSTGRAARVASPLAAGMPSGKVPKRQAKPVPSLSRFGRRVAHISAPALQHTEPARFDFLYGAVASRDFPSLAWRRAYQAVLLRQQHKIGRAHV